MTATYQNHTSTGTVLAGLTKYANDIKPNTNVVAIAADLGERYLDTIYNPEWIRKHFDASLYHSLYPNAKTYLILE
ncbi:hypothetical protein TI05_19525 [Achromatium sp. WMS3]|nr:hypothetical protein TI05_19525 [Achromatium sp. WMS3]